MMHASQAPARSRGRRSLRLAAALVSVLSFAIACGRTKEAAPPGAPASQTAAAQPSSAPAAPAEPAAEEQYATPPPAPAAPAPKAADEARKEAPSSTRAGSGAAAERDALGALETLEQAEAELDRARAELETAFATPQARKRSTAAGAPGRASDGEAKPAAKGETRCSYACRAFASLERAATAVCRIAGSGNDRCTRARQIVADSTRRVSTCGCSAADH